MNPLVRSQVENNLATSGGWSAFAAHRRKVSDLLARAGSAGAGRLCILGAGNCNDVDLALLLDAYREIHLVDLDAASLEAGVARQGLAGNAAVRLHGGIDLTGQLDVMAGWSAQSEQTAADAEALLARPSAHVTPLLPGPFDVVASACVLSQLMDAVVSSSGVEHPRLLESLQGVRLGHLRLLSALTAPGGTAVLISDLVSSDTLPGLATVSEAGLAALLAQAIGERNFFHGVNPEIVALLFRTDPVLSGEITSVEWLSPWLWDLGLRLYAVWGLTARKR